MNTDSMKGKFKQAKGAAKEKWGEATDSQTTRLRGKKDKAMGKIQEKYGDAKEDVARRVNEATEERDDNERS